MTLTVQATICPQQCGNNSDHPQTQRTPHSATQERFSITASSVTTCRDEEGKERRERREGRKRKGQKNGKEGRKKTTDPAPAAGGEPSSPLAG